MIHQIAPCTSPPPLRLEPSRSYEALEGGSIRGEGCLDAIIPNLSSDDPCPAPGQRRALKKSVQRRLIDLILGRKYCPSDTIHSKAAILTAPKITIRPQMRNKKRASLFDALKHLS